MTDLLLDTNVVSEVARPRPDRRVVERLAAAEHRAALSVISWHELWYGVDRLPAGSRRDALRVLVSGLPDRFELLDYDRRAAEWHASERARMEQQGRTPSFADGQIAATAAVRGLRLVTRNVDDFRDFVGLTVESWWA